MVIALLDPARFLTDMAVGAAVVSPADPHRMALTTSQIASQIASQAASQAALRLVATALAADEDSDLYRDLLWQLDAVQRQVDQLAEDGEETALLDRVLDALPLSGEPAAELRDRLAEYELFLQREARLEEALRALALGARALGPLLTPQEFAAYALRAGRLNRLLARWDQATACYAAAAEAGRVLNDTPVLLRSRLGQGAVYRAQGELAAAKAAAEVVMREAERLGLSEVHTLAYWDIGVILRLEGVVGEGLQAVYHASQVLVDPDERRHALRDVALAYAAAGAYDESRAALETVLAVSDDVLLRTSALIGLMDVESAIGDRLNFERRRDEAEGLRGRMPPGMAVAHRYKFGEGLARFGQGRRAYTVLNEALALARANRLGGWCNEIECRLDEPVAKAG